MRAKEEKVRNNWTILKGLLHMPEIICIDLWNCARASDMELLRFQKINKPLKITSLPGKKVWSKLKNLVILYIVTFWLYPLWWKYVPFCCFPSIYHDDNQCHSHITIYKVLKTHYLNWSGLCGCFRSRTPVLRK